MKLSYPFFLIAVCANLLGYNHSIVFVHIGPEIPGYFKDAYQQARLFNKEIPIYLIADKVGIGNYDQQFLKNNYELQIIYCEDLEKTPDHLHYLKYYNPGEYKNGYWVKTGERFFYLQEFMQKYSITNVFHLENDIMIYCELAEILSICEKNYSGIAGTFDCAGECIPGFMYIKSYESLAKYNGFLASKARPMARELSIDMRVPPMFISEFGRRDFDYFPIITPEYVKKFGLKTKFGEVASDSSLYTNHIDEFNSIFDGRALGMYIGGTDPINTTQGPGYVFPCLINASYFSYEWVRDDRGRKIPYAVLGYKKYRINNLHMHCKQLNKFKS